MPGTFWVAAVLLIAGSCAARGQTHPGSKVPQAHQRLDTPARAPGRAGAGDAQLETAIRARLAHSKIGADKFQVRVQGGVATIEGRTDVIQHKGVATRLAKGAGAVAVNTPVQTSDAARQAAAANLAQGRRRAQIKRGEARTDSAAPRQTPPRQSR